MITISIDQLKTGVNKYFSEEILAKTSGFKQFMTGLFGGAYIQKIPALIQDNQQMLKSLSFLTDDNKINLEEIYTHAKSAVAKSGQFVVAGIIFNETDIDKLYSILKGVNQ